jgi:hypothetical protein
MSSYYPTAGLNSDQVLNLIIQLLPRGSEKLYGLLSRRGDVFQYFSGIADTFSYFAFSAIAQLHAELNPQTANLRLPDYELWLGLTQTPIVISGTIDQRRNQVLSKMREQGASTVNNIVGIIAPLLGMLPANVQVIESNQASITTAHTYSNSTGASIGSNSSVTQSVYVPDSGYSDAGAQVSVTITSTNPEQLSFVLTDPSGNQYTMPAGTIPAGALTSTAAPVNFVKVSGSTFVVGSWSLQISTGSAACTLVSWSLFVEGLAVAQDTGGARFWFGVFADPVHLGETGVSANFAAARAALLRIQPAHANGRLLQSIAGAYPNTSSGANSAIPDETLPA